MELTWKYVMKLKDQDTFEEFKEQYGIEVPEDLQQLVKKANAGTPSRFKIMDENGKERVFGAVLSYNKGDDDDVYRAMEVEHNKRYLPFAVDPFGNFFYENTIFGEVLFIDHETGMISKIAESLEEMLRKLY